MTGGSEPWFAREAGGSARKHAPATLRNREPIVDVLRTLMPVRGTVLEIASGSGEHIVHFAQVFPALEWQPSDPDPDGRRSIAAWGAQSGLRNIRPPLDIDASASDWPVGPVDAILCINMVHISPWVATQGLMSGASVHLAPGAPLYLYGPYRRDDVPTAESNEAFDLSLRSRNPEWGLRRVEDMITLGAASGLELERLVEMPANNLSLVFRRRG
ncbi:DUF938 domain-containing protein [Sphingomonas sp. LaA6.9]|uniref:DUF938 domain-containing protein n=1 Tax=Sphingomonas sp. LaA6.9 TaxID=2919914 RepID=UPI001F501BEF|nr:DUF938 domain-containing protein [Sphingomonas sp. LaA6.9]MCJ8155947.1 class I SAM-dependent methyltransferase [Sphingomonas sp. LaA6.9]